MFKEKKKRLNASIDELVSRKKELCNILSNSRIFTIATIVKKMEICGNPKCSCRNKKNPKLHGPYYNLSYRGGDSVGMLHLTPEKKDWADKMVAQYKALGDIIKEISCINLELLRRKDFDALENS